MEKKVRALVHLDSVGCALDVETKLIHTLYKDGTIDEDTGTPVDCISEDFWDVIKGEDLKRLFAILGEEVFEYYRDNYQSPVVGSAPPEVDKREYSDYDMGGNMANDYTDENM